MESDLSVEFGDDLLDEDEDEAPAFTRGVGAVVCGEGVVVDDLGVWRWRCLCLERDLRFWNQ